MTTTTITRRMWAITTTWAMITLVSLPSVLWAKGLKPARILNESLQLEPSSALHWMDVVATEVTKPPLDAVTGGFNKSDALFVCRARISNDDTNKFNDDNDNDHDYHAGVSSLSLSWRCRILVQQQILLLTRFQMLINVDSSARLTWRPWKQFEGLPVGLVAVASNDIFVARTNVEDDKKDKDKQITMWKRLYKVPIAKQASETTQLSRFSLGGLYVREQYGLILVSRQEEMVRATEGDLLTELKPKRLVLTDFVRGRLRSELHTKMRLRNETVWPLDVEQHVKSTTFFSRSVLLRESLLFGLEHHVAKGVNVTVVFPNRTELDVVWGEERSTSVKRHLRIGYHMPVDERMLLVLIATEIQRRFDYTATLQSHFEDGSIYMRPVQGVFRVTVMDNLRPVFEKMATLESLTTTTKSLTTTTSKLVMKGDAEDLSMSKSYRFPIQPDHESHHLSSQTSTTIHHWAKSKCGHHPMSNIHFFTITLVNHLLTHPL